MDEANDINNLNGDKYQHEFSMNEAAQNGSHLNMLKWVKDNAVVLDVGCACGDFGVALKNIKKAQVYGFEYNAKSVEIAMSTGAYTEIIQLNLDNLKPTDFMQYKEKFDYIICGDVLEHLRNPMHVLSVLKSYLKPTGYILASIPNVAHMSIKANLLLNDFTYTPLGLLDETHLHLFTYKSIAQGISAVNLKIEDCKFTMMHLFGWQPQNPYPYLSDEIKKFIFSDWHSYVCQYVMKMSFSSDDDSALLQNNLNKLNINEANAPLYLKEYRNKLLSVI